MAFNALTVWVSALQVRLHVFPGAAIRLSGLRCSS
jgi:hypothetical protein